MKEYFLKFFSYTDWANKKVMDCLNQQQIHDEKILTLAGHILAAQSVWLSRMTRSSVAPYKLWYKYSLTELNNMTDEIGDGYKRYLTGLSGINEIITYKNMAGVDYQNAIDDILIHVANHGTYHRGQIALLLREKGYEPASTDYIIYDRSLRVNRDDQL